MVWQMVKVQKLIKMVEYIVDYLKIIKDKEKEY